MLKFREINQSATDPAFAAIVERLVDGLVAIEQPMRLGIVLVDEWFGPAWRRFSGKAIGRVGLAKRWRLTVPPFHPNRVLSEAQFRRSGVPQAALEIDGEAEPAHVHQPSEANLNRYLDSWGTPALWVWHSRPTHDRAAVLVYFVRGDQADQAWYLSYVRRDASWILDNQAGADRDRVLALTGMMP